MKGRHEASFLRIKLVGQVVVERALALSKRPIGATHGDGDSIDEEVFKIKESEHKASIAEIKSQIRTLGEGNPNFYQDACRTLELSKRLFPLFLQSNSVN
jgi:hypothetical protein